MNKQIDKILKVLKLCVVVIWVAAVLCVLAGENGAFLNWTVEPNGQEEFVLNSVAVCLTLFGTPLSLKFFNLCTAHTLRRMNNDEALHAYLVHGCVRCVMLMLIVMSDVVIYYITANNVTGGLCALIVLTISLVCWPKREQIDTYLEKVNADEEG